MATPVLVSVLDCLAGLSGSPATTALGVVATLALPFAGVWALLSLMRNPKAE